MRKITIPNRPAAFHTFQAAFTGRCASGAASWNLPEPMIARLLDFQHKWDPVYAAAANTHTSCPAATGARSEIFQQYRDAILELIYKHLMDNSAVPAAELPGLGIEDRKVVRTAIPAPESYPLLHTDRSEPFAHHLAFYDSNSPSRRARPKGVGFCEIRYQIGGAAPTLPDVAMSSLNINRSGQALRFDMSDKGKEVFYFARWVSRRGEHGPWSPVSSALIS